MRLRFLIQFIMIGTLLATAGCIPSEPAYTSVTNNVTIMGDDKLGHNVTPLVDNLTHSLVTLHYEHFELHEGHVYSYCSVVNVTGSGNVTILLITPANPIHIQFDVVTEAEASFEIFEGAATSNNGTPQTPVNRARTSNNTATSLVYLTPTLTNIGSMLCEKRWGSGKGIGGGAGVTEEWMFKPNTMYVIRVVNKTVSSQYASVDMNWYVH